MRLHPVWRSLRRRFRDPKAPSLRTASATERLVRHLQGGASRTSFVAVSSALLLPARVVPSRPEPTACGAQRSACASFCGISRDHARPWSGQVLGHVHENGSNGDASAARQTTPAACEMFAAENRWSCAAHFRVRQGCNRRSRLGCSAGRTAHHCRRPDAATRDSLSLSRGRFHVRWKLALAWISARSSMPAVRRRPPVNEPRRRRKDERRRSTPGSSAKSFAKALELVI